MTIWDTAGYLVSSLVITAFCMKDIMQLRIAASVSNVAFLFYGLVLGLGPVWPLHAILLPVNLWRLWLYHARDHTEAGALQTKCRRAAVRVRRSRPRRQSCALYLRPDAACAPSLESRHVYRSFAVVTGLGPRSPER